MAVPKRRSSSTRRDKRRTNWKLKKATVSLCPNCMSPKLPHRVCKHCGYYKGKTVIEVKE